MRAKIIVGLVGLTCVVATWLLARLYQELLAVYEQSGALTVMEYSWFFRLLLNMAGYAIVFLPGIIVYKYLQQTKYFDKINSKGCTYRVLFACFGEPNERLPNVVKSPPDVSPTKESAELVFCFVGLMGSYLVWGILQEKIMTQSYVMPDGTAVRFDDSQFLVFVNRLAALLTAASRLWLCPSRSPSSLTPSPGPSPSPSAPLHKYSYCALTNVLSAWCQYEALKYVSFPTQVLSKSCKVIPVMLMGKLISGNKYQLYEYATAALISVGMALFMLGSGDHGTVSTMTTLSGLTLLALYMVCDSFTSSWQSELFQQYRVSSLQMLCGVNLFSCALTAAALTQQPATGRSLALLQVPSFAADAVLLSASSAVGQLFIYRTIARFGAVVFTIIMTLRQAVSIGVSCAVYGHRLRASGAVGATTVLCAVLLRLYARRRLHLRLHQHARACASRRLPAASTASTAV